MQDVMRRDQSEKEKAQQEIVRLQKQNKQLAIEMEGFRETCGQLAQERDQLKFTISEFEGLREQLE